MENKMKNKLSAGIFITALVVSSAVFFVGHNNVGYVRGAATLNISYTDSGLSPNTNYVYKLILTDRDGKKFSYPDIKAYTSCTPPLPLCTFSASPSTIIPPQSTSLNWNCQNVNLCSIDNAIGSVNPSSGSTPVSPTKTTTYALSCTGTGGASSFNTTVIVNQFKIKEVAP